MKQLFFLLIMLCLGTSTFADNHLVALNPEWLNQEDIDVTTIDIHPRNHTELIQQHLLLVEKTLRARNTDALTPSQKANRLKCLDILHDYAMASTFPTNNHYTYLTPIFVDDNEVYCAVGHLMKETGHRALADRIDGKQELVLVKDIQDQEAVNWMKENGLSRDECAWIQPGYSAATFYVLQDVFLDLSGLTTTTPIVNRALGTPNNLTFSASLTNVGTPATSVTDASGNIWFNYDASGSYQKILLTFSSQATRLVSRIKDVAIPSPAGPPALDSFSITNSTPLLGGFLDANNVPYTQPAALPQYFVSYGGVTGTTEIKRSSFSPFPGIVSEFSVVQPYSTGTTSVSYELSAHYVADPMISATQGATQFQLSVIWDDNYLIASFGIDEIALRLSAEGEGIRATWQDAKYAADETSYILERSQDGTRWMTVSRSEEPIEGSNPAKFEYLDASPSVGMNYYRVARVDKDGNQVYSDIHSINFRSEAYTNYSQLEILGSNVVSDELTIVYDDNISSSDISVYDVSGRRMTTTASKSGSTAVVNTSALSSGYYVVGMGGRFARFLKK